MEEGDGNLTYRQSHWERIRRIRCVEGYMDNSAGIDDGVDLFEIVGR